MYKIAVIADDLTGAADAGVLFAPAAKGMRLLGAERFTRFAQGDDGGEDESPRAVAVCTNTRSMSAPEAEQLVSGLGPALKRMNADLVYKKIDSCLRGHIGVELLSLLDACGRKAALVAPAYPRLGRITRHDLHYVNGVPVALGEAGQDPVHPVTTSGLSENLRLGHNQPVGKVDIAVVQASEAPDQTPPLTPVPVQAGQLGQAGRAGQAKENPLVSAIQNELDQGKRLIAVDADSDAALRAIAAAALTHFPDLILAGSAGLAGAVAACLSAAANATPCSGGTVPGVSLGLASGSEDARPPLEASAVFQSDCFRADSLRAADFQLAGKSVLFVGGSASSVLRGQLDRLAADYGIAREILDAGEVLAGLSRGRRRELEERLKQGDLIVYLSPPDPAGEKLPSQALALALGRLAADLAADLAPGPAADMSTNPPVNLTTGLGALFVSGGDTAQAVLDMLDNPELIINRELAPGLIVSTFASGPHSGLYFLTKSGSFGDAHMLADVYGKLKKT